MIMCAFHGKDDLLKEVRTRARFRLVRGELSRCSEHAPYFEWSTAFVDRYAEAERLLGIPLPILDCGANLYEALRPEEALDLPVQFLDAIRPGADLTPAFYEFIADMLIDSQIGAIRFANSEEQGSLERISRLLTPELTLAHFEDAYEQVSTFEFERLLSMRTWDDHLHFAIGYVGNLSLVLIGTPLHGRGDLSFLIRQVIRWNLVMETYFQKAKLFDVPRHTPELEELGYMAYRTAATRLTEHFLAVLAQR